MEGSSLSSVAPLYLADYPSKPASSCSKVGGSATSLEVKCDVFDESSNGGLEIKGYEI